MHRTAIHDERPALGRLAAQVAEQAIAAGADAAEVVVQSGAELSVKVRRSETELIREAGSRGLGLRVFRDHRAAVTYTSDFTPEGLAAFVADSVALSRLAEPDELNELPEREWLLKGAAPDLDLWDDDALTVTTEDALTRARTAEAAALGYSPKVTNTDGASYSRVVGAGALALADRSGVVFSGQSRGTYQSLVVEPICDDADGKKRNGHYWTADRFLSRLESPEAVGREAARRTIAKLDPEKLATQELPVVFDPDAARALVRLVFSVVSGGAIYRKASYLCGREGTEVASKLVTISDEPHIVRGPGSRGYDGEGLPTRRNVIVEAGALKTYLCDCYSARKLGRLPNGVAGRGVGGSPHVSTSNLMLAPGEIQERRDLWKDLKRGLYVTDMMGFGFNAVTGDFSRGAAGFLIEDGKLTRPVGEITISRNLDELLQGIDAIASDLELRSSIAAPSFRVDRMTVSGR